MATSPFDKLKDKVAPMTKTKIEQVFPVTDLKDVFIAEEAVGGGKPEGENIPEMPTKADKVLDLLEADDADMAALGLVLNEKPLAEKIGFDPNAPLDEEDPKVKEMQDGFMLQASKSQVGEDPFWIDVQLTGLDEYLISGNNNGVMTRAEIISIRKNLKKVMNMEKEDFPEAFEEQEAAKAEKKAAKKQAKKEAELNEAFDKPAQWIPAPGGFDPDQEDLGPDTDEELLVTGPIVTEDMPEGKFAFINTTAAPVGHLVPIEDDGLVAAAKEMGIEFNVLPLDKTDLLLKELKEKGIPFTSKAVKTGVNTDTSGDDS